MAFKLKSQGVPFKMMGSSPLKQPKTFTPYNPYAGVGAKLVKVGNTIRKGLGLTPQGVVGMGLFEGGLAAAEGAVKSWNKAENINMNAPENVKLAEYKYGSSNKSKNIGKTTQIKKGDKIEATGPENY